MAARSPRQRAMGWLAATAQLVVVAALLLGPGSWFAGPAWLAVLGIVLVLAGGLVALAGVTALGGALTPTPVPLAGASLRTTGLYRWVRHPIYSGLLLAGVGVACCAPSPWRLAWWTVLLGLLLAKSAWEERMLAEEYPDYPAYARRTGRFVPRPGSGSG